MGLSWRALAVDSTRTVTPESRESAAARSRLATSMPQLPSAGWVWLPKVTVPSGSTGLSFSRPCGVVGKMPSSVVNVPTTLRPEESGTGRGRTMYRFWKAPS